VRLFSKASEYAIRAMMQVVARDRTGGSSRFSPKDICQEAGIPEAFARKAFQELAKVHILQGTRGPGGGYQFARDLSEVSLMEIVLAVDGDRVLEYCPFGFQCAPGAGGGGLHMCESCTQIHPACGLCHICPLHGLWKEARQLVVRHLKTTSLQDVCDHLRRLPPSKVEARG